MSELFPTSGLRDHTGYWLRRLSDTVHTRFERALAGHDVTVAQWCVLIAVYKGEATTPLEAAELIGIDRGAITRLVDRLVAKGLILRIADPVDRRSVRLVLTEQGRELTPRLAAIADRNDAHFFGGLSDAENRQLVGLLEKLLERAGLEVTGAWREARRDILGRE